MLEPAASKAADATAFDPAGKPQLRLGSSANNAVDGEDPAVTDNG